MAFEGLYLKVMSKKQANERSKTMTHTPTPWETRWGVVINQRRSCAIGNPTACNGGFLMVCELEGRVGELEQVKANAAFIEKACNAHDTLLKAAKKVYERAEWTDKNIEALGKAIALAEGK
jgi:hypothetical protein